eukprot:9038493-Heterocapsa_arctica.AAC.1
MDNTQEISLGCKRIRECAEGRFGRGCRKRTGQLDRSKIWQRHRRQEKLRGRPQAHGNSFGIFKQMKGVGNHEPNRGKAEKVMGIHRPSKNEEPQGLEKESQHTDE